MLCHNAHDVHLLYTISLHDALPILVTTLAPPFVSRLGSSRFVSRNGARWLTCRVISNPSAVGVRSPKIPPALLASTSIPAGPAASLSSPARRRTSSSRAKSATKGCAPVVRATAAVLSGEDRKSTRLNSSHVAI